MTDESEVSCYLCLQADEYGSMLKVSIIPPGFAPRAPLVICRSCGAEVARELWSVLEGENSPARIEPPAGEHDLQADAVLSAIEARGHDSAIEDLKPEPTESSAKQDSE